MTTEIAQELYLEKQMEKQIGCMAGFLQIFDRHQLLAGKRIYSAKRLSPAMDSSSESEHSFSPAVSRELGKPQKMKSLPSPDRSVKQSPNHELRSPEVERPAEIPTKSPLPLPVFEFKEGTRSSWKFSREAPRLSLDSRATVDAKGSLYPREIRTNAAILSANRTENCAGGGVEEIEKQRRSTSVIAKLMGLEPPAPEDLQAEKKGELRRSASASESRVSKDFFHSRFVDGNNFHPKLNQSSSFNFPSNAARDGFDRKEPLTTVQSVDSKEYCVPGKEQNRSLGQRKSFFDSHDIFPEPKQNVTVCGEIERRLKMRGIVEASEDLETLKQILEALQLKGLLHSVKSSNRTSNQSNTVHGRRFPGNESPIVLMRPARSPASPNCLSRNCNDSVSSTFTSRPGAGRNQSRDRQGVDRNVRNQARTRSPSPATRSEGGVKSPHGGRPLNMEMHRKQNISTDQRRLSPVHSPKASPRRTPPAQQSTNRSPRNRKPTAEKAGFVPAEDESSSISESSISTPSQTDTERSKMEYKEGRSLLERCDQLLLSIAEITSPELQPSPVSVLDSSSFYGDESSWSPSPVTKRSIDFKEAPIGFAGEVCPVEIPSLLLENESENKDFIYISEIFRASSYLPVDSDVFIELENQQFLKGKDTSQASRVERKLIFDTITEILDRNRQLPPWKIASCLNSWNPKPDLQQTWSEFLRIKERGAASEDLFEIICGALRKDLAGDAVAGWGGRPVEMSEAVLDIERLVFKDLIGETIGELAHSGGNCSIVPAALRRKLVF